MANIATMARKVDRPTVRKAMERGMSSMVAARLIGQPAPGSDIRSVQPVAHAAHGLDQIESDLAAQAADKDFDRIGIAVEILIVEMLDQFRAGNDLALMMHQ